MMKLLSVAILVAGFQIGAPVSSHAQSTVRQAASELATKIAKELAQRGVEESTKDVADKLRKYFTRNKDEINKPQADLMQRLVACRTGSPDPLCGALRNVSR